MLGVEQKKIATGENDEKCVAGLGKMLPLFDSTVIPPKPMRGGVDRAAVEAKNFTYQQKWS